MTHVKNQGTISGKQISGNIRDYLLRVQDFTPGEFYGAFWSEKAYHGPLLDWNAGGAHHHRGCGSGALALWMTGDKDIQHRAELAFDWLVSRQHSRGGWFEIQNHEKPSDWEKTGREELSTISTGFAIHGMAEALLNGLPPKKSYMDCLQNAGHWFLGIEFPPGSGIFPHHERSPYDTLNANMHTADALFLIGRVLDQIYSKRLNIFSQGVKRAVSHTLGLQWENGCMPYRDYGWTTINYTSLVLWCLLNVMEHASQMVVSPFTQQDMDKCKSSLAKGCEFLRGSINPDGTLNWEEFETSSAKFNLWTYFITINVLLRKGGEENSAAAAKLLNHACRRVGRDGLPEMRDNTNGITECAFMQADILMFLQGLPEGCDLTV